MVHRPTGCRELPGTVVRNGTDRHRLPLEKAFILNTVLPQLQPNGIDKDLERKTQFGELTSTIQKAQICEEGALIQP